MALPGSPEALAERRRAHWCLSFSPLSSFCFTVAFRQEEFKPQRPQRAQRKKNFCFFALSAFFAANKLRGGLAVGAQQFFFALVLVSFCRLFLFLMTSFRE